jgi:hypothetical protein
MQITLDNTEKASKYLKYLSDLSEIDLNALRSLISSLLSNTFKVLKYSIKERFSGFCDNIIIVISGYLQI